MSLKSGFRHIIVDNRTERDFNLEFGYRQYSWTSFLPLGNWEGLTRYNQGFLDVGVSAGERQLIDLGFWTFWGYIVNKERRSSYLYVDDLESGESVEFKDINVEPRSLTLKSVKLGIKIIYAPDVLSEDEVGYTFRPWVGWRLYILDYNPELDEVWDSGDSKSGDDDKSKEDVEYVIEFDDKK